MELINLQISNIDKKINKIKNSIKSNKRIGHTNNEEPEQQRSKLQEKKHIKEEMLINEKRKLYRETLARLTSIKYNDTLSENLTQAMEINSNYAYQFILPRFMKVFHDRLDEMENSSSFQKIIEINKLLEKIPTALHEGNYDFNCYGLIRKAILNSKEYKLLIDKAVKTSGYQDELKVTSKNIIQANKIMKNLIVLSKANLDKENRALIRKQINLLAHIIKNALNDMLENKQYETFFNSLSILSDIDVGKRIKINNYKRFINNKMTI